MAELDVPPWNAGFSEAQRNLGMPSIAPESRLVQRTEAQRKLAERESRLRQRCIDSLGEPVYTQLYEFLKERGKLYSDDDDMALVCQIDLFGLCLVLLVVTTCVLEHRKLS